MLRDANASGFTVYVVLILTAVEFISCEGAIKYPITPEISMDAVEASYAEELILMGATIIWKIESDIKGNTKFW